MINILKISDIDNIDITNIDGLILICKHIFAEDDFKVDHIFDSNAILIDNIK